MSQKNTEYYFVFGLLVLSSFYVKGQTDTLSIKKHNLPTCNQSPLVSINGGLSVPIGDFASRKYSGITSNTDGTITNFRGWATLGEAISLKASIPVYGEWGINLGCKIGYNLLPFDIKTLTENMSEGNSNAFSQNGVLASNDWKLYSFLTGISEIYYTYKISIGVDVFVGKLYLNSPNETYTNMASYGLGYPWPFYDTMHFSSSKNNLFIAETQVSFKYFLLHQVFCQLNISYEASFSNFNYTGYISSFYSGPIQPGSYNPSSYSVINGSTPISTLAITLGVGYKF